MNLHYVDEILKYYSAFSTLNIPVDIIGAEDDLSAYNVVVAPVLYMVKDGYDEKIRSFVKNGGSFLTTFFSGYVDKNDLVTVGGYPGKLRDILGIWVEEEDALPEGTVNSFTYKGTTYPAELICDLLHTEGAASLCGYESDFYKGMPAITNNAFGQGHAYYMATASNEEFYLKFIGDICDKAGVMPIMKTPRGVEATVRENKNGSFLFLLNHSEEEQTVTLPAHGHDCIHDCDYKEGDSLKIAAKDVVILQKK